MSRIRIVILSPFFFPEPISTGKFNTDLAKALRENNAEVTVICSHPFYPSWKTKNSNETLEGIKIIRGKNPFGYPNNFFIKRALLELWFGFFAVKKFRQLQTETDLIIPVFPPGLAFYFLLPLLKNKTRKVAIVHDLQEVYIENRSHFFHKMIRSVIHKIEKTNFNCCDKLIFLSNEMKETAKSFYGLEEEKLVVQYPFVNIDLSSQTNDLDEILPQGTNHIVYSGALGEKQNPVKLYSFFDFSSKKMPKAEFHFFSEGKLFDQLRKNNSNQRIKFHHLVEDRNILELYGRSTVQIIPQKEGTSKGSLPSKLPNLLVSGCNLMVITDSDSELEMLFKEYNLNNVVTSWDNLDLYKKLKEIIYRDAKADFDQGNLLGCFQLNGLVEKIIDR